jgi:hypothetical protein
LTYHFLEDLSGNWVVVIGIDLLSLACSSLVWVVAMFQHHAYVTPVAIMVALILLVWRIGFGVMGMELVGVILMVQGFVRCDAGSLWLVIIAKSNDRFMERAPMKIVQP